MKELIKQKCMFELLSTEINSGIVLDEPECWLRDYYDEPFTVPIDSYMDDYCTTIFPDEVHLFTNNFHFIHYPSTKEIRIYLMFHFNTSEYGVPPEYYRDELHDNMESCIAINSNGFWFSDENYTYSTEEEIFHLSCTELGFYIDIVERAKEFIYAEIQNRECREV
ncbi:hypothetical protein ACETM9_003542 [Salmonella enterica]